jgi:transcriptional regulator with XRE-family HTH domain
MATRTASIEGETFGRALRAIRDEKGLSQQALAERAGLTTNYISDVERGIKVPSLTTILQLAYGLGIEPGELLTSFSPVVVKRILKRVLML